MFEASVGSTRFPTRRSGAGAIVSVAAHVVVLAALVRAHAQPAEKKTEPASLTVRFASAPPPPPPPGGPAAPRAEPRHEQVPRKRDPLTLRPKVDRETPPTPTQAPEPQPGGEPGGQEGGVIGGQPGGVIGGQPGGVVGGTGTVVAPAAPPPTTNIVLPFGEGMNRPQRIAGPDPVYPREAREAKVEGTSLVQCTITVEGRLVDCNVLKSLPFLDQPVLAALAQQRYTPVTFQGRPVAVRYVIPFKFKLE